MTEESLKAENEKVRSLARERYNREKGWRDIIIWPDATLNRPCRPVSEDILAAYQRGDHPELHRLLDDMGRTLTFMQGFGLAAPQIGIGLRVFVLLVWRKTDNLPPVREILHCINPELTFCSEEKETRSEGCMSIPGLTVPMERHSVVRARAIGYDGKPFEFGGDKELASAIQHEMDHLEGRLVVDSLSQLKRDMLQRRYIKAKKLKGLRYITPFDRMERIS
jgi:peptide deformylase